MNLAPLTTLIIGVGNADRGDDGAGVAAAHLLMNQVADDVSVIELSGEGTAVMDAWRGASRVFVVDAVCSGATPGTVHRFDVSSAPLPAALFPCTTHGFGVAGAIEMARALHELPPQVIVYGIEAASFDESRELSRELQHAVTAVCAQILGELLPAHENDDAVRTDSTMR
jgi:hydrogenase maturation protease